MDSVIPHTHNGLDAPYIPPYNFLIFSDVIPSKSAKEGTMVLYVNGTTYRLYIRINKSWKYVALS